LENNDSLWFEYYFLIIIIIVVVVEMYTILIVDTKTLMKSDETLSKIEKTMPLMSTTTTIGSDSFESLRVWSGTWNLGGASPGWKIIAICVQLFYNHLISDIGQSNLSHWLDVNEADLFFIATQVRYMWRTSFRFCVDVIRRKRNINLMEQMIGKVYSSLISEPISIK
jgi:hypothetical protein